MVRNKADITGETLGMSEVNGHALIRLSARTGEGVDVLRNHLKQSMGFDTNMEGGFRRVVVTYRRWNRRQSICSKVKRNC